MATPVKLRKLDSSSPTKNVFFKEVSKVLVLNIGVERQGRANSTYLGGTKRLYILAYCETRKQHVILAVFDPLIRAMFTESNRVYCIKNYSMAADKPPMTHRVKGSAGDSLVVVSYSYQLTIFIF